MAGRLKALKTFIREISFRRSFLREIFKARCSQRKNRKYMSKEPNYTEAFQELQEIVLEIEQGEISVDELSEKVKRAAILIKICKTKLTNTEEDVSKILKELEKSTEEKE